MKKCKIAPPSCTHSDKPCCRECPDKACTNRCWNSPERCGCWTQAAPRQARGGKGGRSVDWAEVVRLHGQGLTQRQIAGWLGCAPATVFNALKKMGVAGRG